MAKLKVAVHGLGNIGKNCIEAIMASSDMECVGVVRRKESIGKDHYALLGAEEFESVDALIAKKGKPDICLIATPSRLAPDDAIKYLEKGINTVDSFDIHTQIVETVEKLDAAANKGGATAITAAGWDPGSDSVLRTLLEAMCPRGTTFTNFGRGRSMGHSVAARAISGVKDATSITIPMGGGKHARLVYLLLEDGADFKDVSTRLQADDYFAHDPLDVRQVFSKEELDSVCDASHGVLLERTGASGMTDNQIFKFDMRINNPALTAQIMVSCGRASLKMNIGAFTMIDIPPVYYLPGERKANIKRLV